ncbi:MAG: Holliday junction resolvase RuvX [Anaerolineales bacterium]|nr:MAG: Holliday junction resolvase RuvX [Anaerolineales bacterium]
MSWGKKTPLALPLEVDLMRVMALDVGHKRIGVALSDPGQVLASTLQVIERKGQQRDLATVIQLVREHEVGKIIVGYPRSLNGTVGRQAKIVERYAAVLEKKLRDSSLDVPVILWDERFSTVVADRLMAEAGRKSRERRKRIDAVAAAVILQDYLDAIGV